MWSAVDLIPCSLIATQFFDFSDKPKNQARPQLSVSDDPGDYTVPEGRALGRPHNLNWLQKMDELEEAEGEDVFGQVPAGKIIME